MPTIKEPISGLDESSPLLVTPRELLGQTRNSSWVPFSLLLVLTSQVLQHFSRNKPALNPPSPPYPAQPLLSFLQPIHYAFEYLFDFLTRFITTRLWSSAFYSLPGSASWNSRNGPGRSSNWDQLTDHFWPLPLWWTLQEEEASERSHVTNIILVTLCLSDEVSGFSPKVRRMK